MGAISRRMASHYPLRITHYSLDRHRGFDRRVRVVVLESEVLVLELEEVVDGRVELHFGLTARAARELLASLVEVIEVEMGVAESVHQFAGLEAADLRDHPGEQRVGSDVERHAEKHVRAALVHLARQLPVRDVELEKGMTRQQRHFRQVGDVPRGYDHAPGIRVFLKLINNLRYLVDMATVWSRPRAPLVAVDRPQIAFRVCPFIPDSD